MSKSAFKGPEAKLKLEAWFERFRARIDRPTESRRVPTRFGDTHVLVGGPAGAPALVLLHGALASSAHVLHELAPLLERFRVYAVDIVGQSVKSADARPRVDNDEYGEWLVDVLDGLGLARAHVVGVSWGGFVAIRLAVVAPERIARLALLVPAGVVKSPAWQGLTRIAWPLLRYRLSPTPERRAAFVRHLLTTQDDDCAPYLGDAILAFNSDMRVPRLAEPAELRGFTAPTLVLGADRDVSFPGRALRARAPQLFASLADQELLADCAHCPPTTAEFRRWLSARIAGFLLASQAAAPAARRTGSDETADRGARDR
jgi:pimeloyl-ACP methyl ester carboxylesterase